MIDQLRSVSWIGLSIGLAFVFANSSRDLSGEDWTRFRGPSGSGTTSEKGLPDQWSESSNVLWKKAVHGRAWSSPIVTGNKVILTTAVSTAELEAPKKGLYFGGNRLKPRDSIHSWRVLCFDKRTGDELWQTECANGKPTAPIHLKNSYASETPATDGERIYAFFGAEGLFCLDLEGNKLWEREIGKFKMRDGWGTSSSPVVDDSNVYLQCFNEEQSFVLALNKMTGDEVWRKDVEEKSSWSSPFLWENSQRAELITVASGYARSFDPQTGKLNWKIGKQSSIVCPTPIADNDLLYLSSGYVGDSNRPIIAIKPGASGDLGTKDAANNRHIAWSLPKAGPYNPSPLLYEGRLYVLLDRGFFTCYDAATGEQVCRAKRIDGSDSGFTVSPWAYDGKVFCLNEDGECFVFKAGKDGTVQLHTNSLGEMCMASPAISDGLLFIRTINHLYAIGEHKPLAREARKR